MDEYKAPDFHVARDTCLPELNDEIPMEREVSVQKSYEVLSGYAVRYRELQEIGKISEEENRIMVLLDEIQGALMEMGRVDLAGIWAEFDVYELFMSMLTERPEVGICTRVMSNMCCAMRSCKAVRQIVSEDEEFFERLYNCMDQNGGADLLGAAAELLKEYITEFESSHVLNFMGLLDRTYESYEVYHFIAQMIDHLIQKSKPEDRKECLLQPLIILLANHVYDHTLSALKVLTSSYSCMSAMSSLVYDPPKEEKKQEKGQKQEEDKEEEEEEQDEKKELKPVVLDFLIRIINNYTQFTPEQVSLTLDILRPLARDVINTACWLRIDIPALVSLLGEENVSTRASSAELLFRLADTRNELLWRMKDIDLVRHLITLLPENTYQCRRYLLLTITRILKTQDEEELMNPEIVDMLTTGALIDTILSYMESLDDECVLESILQSIFHVICLKSDEINRRLAMIFLNEGYFDEEWYEFLRPFGRLSCLWSSISSHLKFCL